MTYYKNGSHFKIQHDSLTNNESNDVNEIIGITNIGIATIFKPLSYS